MLFHKLRKMVQPINVILCNTLANSKICQNKSNVCLFYDFFLFCWSKANFIWKIVSFKFQDLINLGVVSWCAVNYATEGNPTKISKFFQKYFEFFFLSFCFFVNNQRQGCQELLAGKVWGLVFCKLHKII